MLSCDIFSRAKFAKDDAYILGWKIPPAVGQGSWSSVEYLARRTQRVKGFFPMVSAGFQNRVPLHFSRIRLKSFSLIHPQQQNRAICNFKEFFQIVLA